jgi:hypothetical protein
MSIRDSNHYDDSPDLIERIRKLREAAEKKMNVFGDPKDYEVRIISGRKSKSVARTETRANDSAGGDSQ